MLGREEITDDRLQKSPMGASYAALPASPHHRFKHYFADIRRPEAEISRIIDGPRRARWRRRNRPRLLINARHFGDCVFDDA